MSNPELIASFVAYLRHERGATVNTIASYENDIRKFAEWAGKPLPQAGRLDLQRFLSDSITDGKSGQTVGRRLASLRQFYRFLIDEEEITKDPTRNLPAPKQWKTVPKALSQVDLEAMVNSLGNSRLEIRDRAIMLTFFASGLRESELADLKLQDLDLDAGIAKVWAGKGNKDGIVPLSPPAVTALREYLASVRPGFAARSSSSFLFLGRWGRQLTRQQVYNRVRNTARAALGKDISPHFLRHGFATALVEGGADIRDIQVLMRHSSVDTTAIYIHIDLTYLRRIYYASHPRARIAQAQT